MGTQGELQASKTVPLNSDGCPYFLNTVCSIQDQGVLDITLHSPCRLQAVINGTCQVNAERVANYKQKGEEGCSRRPARQT